MLPRLVGRSRALEIVLSADDFDADIAERYGWVNRTLDDDELTRLSMRSCCVWPRSTVKHWARRGPDQSVQDADSPSFGRATTFSSQPGVAQCAGAPRQSRGIGYGVPSDFELNRPAPPALKRDVNNTPYCNKNERRGSC
jgi:hypothetical protein